MQKFTLQMRHLYLLLIFTFFFSTIAFAQTGSIKGTIKSENKENLYGINVALKGTVYGDATDEYGNYEINNIPVGNYLLSVQSIAYKSQEKTVEVQQGNIQIMDFTLEEASEVLQEVEIVGRKEATYKNNMSFIGTKTATPIMKVPQAISYVTKEVMQDQKSFRTSDVLKNVSGVNQFSVYDDYVLRGFRSSTQLMNGLKVVGGFWVPPLTANLERVEVIKGPASALFGNTDPGGSRSPAGRFRRSRRPASSPSGRECRP